MKIKDREKFCDAIDEALAGLPEVHHSLAIKIFAVRDWADKSAVVINELKVSFNQSQYPRKEST